MGDVERVMERVHRLLAIANDPAASDNEQHIALEQAQRLMNKHAIEEWQLEEDHDDVEIIERRIRLETNPCNRYMAQLANIVAHGNRCRPASPPPKPTARPSDSRRPARSPIGLWKSRKTPAKYHTCVIYLGYRQGIGQPASPQ